MNQAYLCATCGVQFEEAQRPPEICPICEDERQYVPRSGQEWMTPAQLRSTHHNRVRSLEPGLTSIQTKPHFAMGHQALVVQSSGGNVLWDCVSLLDEPTVDAIAALGGLTAIAISHPHFYDTMVEWSRTFGDIPVYLHTADRDWVMRPDPCLRFWDGESCALNDDLTLIHCGGHYEGSAVLHWASGADRSGVLLSGDTIAPMLRPDVVTFMYSFPNMIPLSGDKITRIVRSIEPYTFDRLYGIWFDRVVGPEAKSVVRSSADRYRRAIGAARLPLGPSGRPT